MRSVLEPRMLLVASIGVIGPACILESNPAFMPGEGTGTVATGGTMDGGPGGTVGPSGTDGTAGVTDTSDDTGTTGGFPDQGCSNPDECTVLHVGPSEDLCPHEVDGVMTTTCDFTGTYGLRIAAGTAEAQGGQALILMYPDASGPGRFLGGVEIPGDTTLTAAPGVTRDMIEVYFGGEVAGVFRLIGDSVHLHDFTAVVDAGSQHAFITRLDPDTEGTETGGHLIEDLLIAVSRSEDVGGNSMTSVFESVGPDTLIRNNHIWGYFEDNWDFRFANRTTVAHNTILAYQNIGSEPLFNALLVDSLEISNNVIASLTETEAFLVGVDPTTQSVTVAGNLIEGFVEVLGPGAPAAPGLVEIDNVLGELPAESPHQPQILADATVAASPGGTSSGRSLDGVSLDGAARLLPGAYQDRSAQSGPRPTVVRVGDGGCGGEPCDFERSDIQEIQYGVWRTWPGGTLEIHPSAEPYAGPAVVSWPMTVRGTGDQPDEVVLRYTVEDAFLAEAPPWEGNPSVLRVNRNLGATSIVENLTLEAGPDQHGITHEGFGAVGGPTRHQLRRLLLRDDGTTGGAPASQALLLGTNVVAHDILVHGDFSSCVRFGPRGSETSQTPASTAFVHHLTCRLTEPVPGGSQAVFDVANVDGAIMADVVAELSDGGAIFRAQRRTSNDGGALAVDTPDDFTAHSLVVRGHGSTYDDFDPGAGSFSVTALVVPLAADPMFVSGTNSHLAAGAAGIDDGVDPSTLDGDLSLQISLDGVDRSGQTPDRGCYEQ